MTAFEYVIIELMLKKFRLPSKNMKCSCGYKIQATRDFFSKNSCFGIMRFFLEKNLSNFSALDWRSFELCQEKSFESILFFFCFWQLEYAVNYREPTVVVR